MKQLQLPGLLMLVLAVASGACASSPTPAPRESGTPSARATSASSARASVAPSSSAGSSAAPGATASATANASPAGSAPSPSDAPSSSPTAPVASAEPPSPAASTPPFDPAAVAVSAAPFATGLQAPVFATGRRDGSGGLLVVEDGGRIRIVDADGTVEPTPFLDIGGRIVSGGERGLLGLALSPDYENDGHFYLDYTRKPDGATVVSEFQANDRFGDPGSERVLLTIPQPFPNHNGGMLAFDRAGMLLIGMGDGGSGGDPQGNGQNPRALLGKILRIDVNGNPYAIPADNPFAASTTTAPEVWDLGMRNPWRFSFDRQTGDLFIGDVGQGGWEEIDAEPAGQGGRNYGWNTMEGRHCYAPAGCDQTGLTLPVSEYSHDAGCAVVGGYVYRGAAYPALRGAYLFSDDCSGTIWALSAADALRDGTAAAAVVASSGLQVSSFGQDDNGELYIVDLGGGQVLKLSGATR